MNSCQMSSNLFKNLILGEYLPFDFQIRWAAHKIASWISLRGVLEFLYPDKDTYAQLKPVLKDHSRFMKTCDWDEHFKRHKIIHKQFQLLPQLDLNQLPK